ncbi:hypothetical protein KYLE_106 [Pantoea phage Kyle]|uniref:Uncharacterized protein n=1 Tax=Pantoea phage Kyle TaxID=2589665 RepID=A0A514A8P4_9CAUD|nr:hypothetical protein HWC52_gp106 [Pantoea phage Kyle]QDH49594.1 hypothetical protein KYLE_106 [Pantoea phage Kyle]
MANIAGIPDDEVAAMAERAGVSVEEMEIKINVRQGNINERQRMEEAKARKKANDRKTYRQKQAELRAQADARKQEILDLKDQKRDLKERIRELQEKLIDADKAIKRVQKTAKKDKERLFNANARLRKILAAHGISTHE